MKKTVVTSGEHADPSDFGLNINPYKEFELFFSKSNFGLHQSSIPMVEWRPCWRTVREFRDNERKTRNAHASMPNDSSFADLLVPVSKRGRLLHGR